MKKWIALLLVVLTVTAFAACSKSDEKPADPTTEPTKEPTEEPTDEPADTPIDEPDDDVPLVGGWALSNSPEVTDEVRSVLDKAASWVDDVGFEPVAYVASQVVAGFNYLILCKEEYSLSVSGAVTYALVTIYEDLQGNAEITSIAESGVSADYPTDVDGGWGEAASPVITEGVKAAYDITDENGVSYRPLALLATQVVAGMNYRCLCCVTTAGQKSSSNYVIAEVFRSLEGDSAVTSVKGFRLV